jgi:uncharacterized protein YoxC
MRSESMQAINCEAQNLRAHRAETRKALENCAGRLHNLEESTNDIQMLKSQLKAMELRLSEFEQQQRDVELRNIMSFEEVNKDIRRLDSRVGEVTAQVESVRATASRVCFDVEQNTARVNNYMHEIEQRVEASLRTHEEEMRHEMLALTAKHLNQTDEVRKLVETKDMEMLLLTKKQYKTLSDNIDNCRRKCSDDSEILTTQMRNEISRKVEQLQSTLSASIKELAQSSNEQAGFMCDLEEGVMNQLGTLNTKYKSIAAAEAKLNTSTQAMERSIEDLARTTAANTAAAAAASTSFASSFVNPAPGTPAGSAAAATWHAQMLAHALQQQQQQSLAGGGDAAATDGGGAGSVWPPPTPSFMHYSQQGQGQGQGTYDDGRPGIPFPFLASPIAASGGATTGGGGGRGGGTGNGRGVYGTEQGSMYRDDANTSRVLGGIPGRGEESARGRSQQQQQRSSLYTGEGGALRVRAQSSSPNFGASARSSRSTDAYGNSHGRRSNSTGGTRGRSASISNNNSSSSGKSRLRALPKPLFSSAAASASASSADTTAKFLQKFLTIYDADQQQITSR